MAPPMLAVSGLRTHFPLRGGVVKAVDDVSFRVGRGEVLGLVGESGSGKTVTGWSIIGVLDPPGRVVAGSIRLDGEELVGYYFLWDFDQPAPVLGIGLADAWQGQGLGRLMLRHLIEEARRAGRDAIELTTGLGNERAFRLYRRVGFELVGEVDNVAGDGRIVRERRMFLPLKPGVQPVERSFEPPTSPA